MRSSLRRGAYFQKHHKGLRTPRRDRTLQTRKRRLTRRPSVAAAAMNMQLAVACPQETLAPRCSRARALARQWPARAAQAAPGANGRSSKRSSVLVRFGVLDDDEGVLAVRRHHHLVPLRADPQEGEVVLRVQVADGRARLGNEQGNQSRVLMSACSRMSSELERPRCPR